MKIINLGILAHVDAGKTTLTESLLYTSGAIAELGSVDEGTTRTDTMNLERQRGITIQTAVTSFQWEDVKVNIIDTPGHMDFLAEVYRSLSVLDGAVLLVSAKDGIQAQTRILFHALQTMKIPTIFFINKIDQEGIDLPMVYREMKAKLSSEIIVKQKVGQHPHINVTDNDDMEQWDAVIMGNDELLEKYMSGKPFKMSELEQEENRRFQNGTLFPVYHGSAKNNLGIRQLIEVIASKFYSSTPEGQSELCGQVFKIEYSEKRRRFVGKLRAMMRIDIITVLPELLQSPLNYSILKRAQDKKLVEIVVHNLRDYSLDKHRRVDDYPFGGEAGMVMQIEPVDRAITQLKSERNYDEVIFTTPDGERFDQPMANRLSMAGNLIILCGHYKGIDYRIREHFVTKEVTIGDYVLTGGELAAAIMCDAIVRLIPGAIGDEQSALSDSFQDNLLAPPVYTRPAEYKGWRVPDVLLSGHQRKIDEWKHEQSLERTRRLRPDLLE